MGNGLHLHDGGRVHDDNHLGVVVEVVEVVVSGGSGKDEGGVAAAGSGACCCCDTATLGDRGPRVLC